MKRKWKSRKIPRPMMTIMNEWLGLLAGVLVAGVFGHSVRAWEKTDLTLDGWQKLALRINAILKGFGIGGV